MMNTNTANLRLTAKLWDRSVENKERGSGGIPLWPEESILKRKRSQSDVEEEHMLITEVHLQRF